MVVLVDRLLEPLETLDIDGSFVEMDPDDDVEELLEEELLEEDEILRGFFWVALLAPNMLDPK